MKSGDTYSRTFGTTIGSESLTTVFGMGTGVASRILSPENRREGGEALAARILVVEFDWDRVLFGGTEDGGSAELLAVLGDGIVRDPIADEGGMQVVKHLSVSIG